MSDLHHECGIAAIYYHGSQADDPAPIAINAPEQTSNLMPRMLLEMQHRGQLAAGIARFRPGKSSLIKTEKGLGTVTEVFKDYQPHDLEQKKQDFDGIAAIGHVRYATCGGEDLALAQPFERSHGRKSKWFALAFNGQIANFAERKKSLLKDSDYHLRTNTDTEILMHSISYELADEQIPIDWAGVFNRLSKRFDGAYNVALLSATGQLVVARDPLGLRPLCYASEGPVFAAASESNALANLGFTAIKSLPPGHLAIVEPGSVQVRSFVEHTRSAHCFFEWIYFANVASTLDDRSVYLSRANLGRELAKLERQANGGDEFDADTIIVPVPDTAKAAADAMAFELKLPSMEGVIRNRHMGRTFIEGAENREARVRLKYTPLPEVLTGKRVLLVEDSIVRATTLGVLVQQIRSRGGAREIHLRIAAPPIIAPCYYGIDMSTRSELIAPRFADLPHGGLSEAAQERLARHLGADSLRYLPVDSLARAINLESNQLCLGCVTGRYPTPKGQALYDHGDLIPAVAANGTGGLRAYE